MRRNLTGLLVAFFLGQSLVFAGPLVRSQVAASAEWVMHIDVTKLGSARIGALIQSSNALPQLQESITLCQQDLGFHPLKDLEQVTLYGETAGGQTGVALLQGAVKQGKIIKVLRENPSYRKITSGKRTFHQWNNPRDQKPVTMCFYQDNLMVLATSQPLVEGALEVLEGKVPNMKSGGRVAVPATDAILVLAMTRGTNALPSPMSNADAMSAVLLETKDGMLNLDVDLTTTSEQEATKAQQTCQFFVLSAVAMAEQNPDLAGLARNTSITGSGKNVKIQIRYASDKVLELIQKSLSPQAPVPATTPSPPVN